MNDEDKSEDVEFAPETDDDMRRDNLHDAKHKVEKLRHELEKTRKEKQENLDGWQRAKADYVNLLKRSQDDVRSAKHAGAVQAIEALLPAYDAIERAKEHGEVPEGFKAIVKQFESAFASLGLVSVGEAGEIFNPIIHEAFGQDAVKDKADDDTVTVVLEKGWKQGDRIIRPAKVRVGRFEN